MLVISGTALIVILVVYVFVSVLLLSIMHEDLDEEVSRLGFFLTAPIVVVAGMLSAMVRTRGAYWVVYKATVKRLPGDKVRAFIQRVRRRGWGHYNHVRSLKQQVQWVEQRLESQEAQENNRAHRLAEGVLNQHWLDATVKVREALSQALTDACRIASEKADKAESEAMEALRIRAETAEQMLVAYQVAAGHVHGRTPGGEQGLEPEGITR